MTHTTRFVTGVAVTLLALVPLTSAQDPVPPTGGGRGRQGGPPRPNFPQQQRVLADAAVLARGRALYESTCSACHGIDLRGGQLGGPNLLRSQLVLGDKSGELIGPVIQSGRPNPTQGGTPMPPFPLPADDIKAIAEYLHSVLAQAGAQGRPPAGEMVPPVTSSGGASPAIQARTLDTVLSDIDIGAIRDLERRWLAEEMTGNPGAVLDLCTDDVVWMAPMERTLRGKDAIRAWLGKTGGRIEDLRLNNVRIDGDGDIGYKTADYETRYVPAGSTQTVTVAGSHVWVLRRLDARWHVALVAWTCVENAGRPDDLTYRDS